MLSLQRRNGGTRGVVELQLSRHESKSCERKMRTIDMMSIKSRMGNKNIKMVSKLTLPEYPPNSRVGHTVQCIG